MVANPPSEPPTTEPEDLEDHPGRPHQRDELDPELMVLTRPRPQIGPILAGSVLIACLYFMVVLWSDLNFARESKTPTPIDLNTAIESFELGSFVEIRAVPDRAYQARVRPSEASLGRRIAPVIGSGGRLWILIGGSPWAEPATYDEIYRGRLERLADMPFAGSLAAYSESRGPMPHFVSPDVLRAALAEQKTSLLDLTGEPITVIDSTPVEVFETVSGKAQIVAFATDDQPDEGAWTDALVKAGILASPTAPVFSHKDRWTYLVPAPEGVDSLQARLVEARLFAAQAEKVTHTYSATWSALKTDEAGISIGKGNAPWTSISAISVEVATPIPDGARVLITAESPAMYWYMQPLYALLLLFAGLFAWGLFRSLRPLFGKSTADAS